MMTMISENNHRFQSDRRQIGGLLLVLGFCSIIQPSANLVSGYGPNGANTTDPLEIPFWGLVGGHCLFINGIAAVLLGYLACVHDFSHKHLTQCLMITIQTAWIPYITDMTDVGKASRLSAEENRFIPQAYHPSDTDVKFVGAMGIIAILAYGFAFVGSIAFMVWTLHAYNTDKPQERSGSYFRGRLGFYSGVLAIGGLAQLLLGVYSGRNFHSSAGDSSSDDFSGVLKDGPVAVAMLIVTYPPISIIVGLLQTLNGLWGVVRTTGFHSGSTDNTFQLNMGLQWIMVVALQIIAQIAYLPGGEAAAAAPTIVAMSLGLNLMPAFLDYKMRTLPDELPNNYYSSVNTSEEQVGGSGDGQIMMMAAAKTATVSDVEPTATNDASPNEDDLFHV